MMRRFYGMIVSAAILLFVDSCATMSLPRRLDSFVDDAELKCDKYSNADWDRSRRQYEHLVDRYMNSERDYSVAESRMAARAMTRYYVLEVKNGISESAGYVEALGKAIPEYVDELSEELKVTKNALTSAFRKVFNKKNVKKFLNEVEDFFDDLF